MKKAFQVLARDIRRIIAIPMAVVTVAGLCVIPALYSWFNVAAFWNPYDNTGNLRVAVVNEDRGATSDATGRISIGDQVETSLKSNHQLGWTFMDRDQALDEVRSGTSYAAIIIPKDFSADLLTITSGDFTQPKLEYYVNEKINATAPRVTDTGATTLERQINSQFVSTVSRVAVSTLSNTADQVDAHASKARSKASEGIGKASAGVDDAQKQITELIDSVNQGSAKVQQAKTGLAAIDAKATNARTTLDNGIASLSDAQNGLTTLNTGLSAASANASQSLSQGSQTANTFIGQASGTMLGAQQRLDSAVSTAQTAVDTNRDIIETLKTSEFAQTDAGKQLIVELEQHNKDSQSALDAIGTASTNAGNSATAIANASNSVNTATQNTLTSLQTAQNAISGNVSTGLNSALGSFSASATTLSGALAGVSPAIDEATVALDQLQTTLDKTAKALTTTKDALGSTKDSLTTIGTDLDAVSAADATGRIKSMFDASDEDVAKFVASPTTLTTKTIYPLNSYGSAVAPMFTNLSLWIGAFSLAMLFHLEVDDEGIRGLKANQKYMGRWMLLALIACLQAIVATVGNIVIGIQTVNPLAYVGTSMLIALVYSAIIYSLCVSLAHVGRGLCVVLTVLQVPGSSGMYPIEMMPSEFQRIYPWLPITYGNNAIRETIGGFYDHQYWSNLGVLALFAAVAFLIGMAVRPYLNNLNMLLARQLRETDLLNGDKPIAVRNRYSLNQVMRALSDSTEFRAGILHRAARFERAYPRLKLGALIAGVILPVCLTVFSLSTNEKIAILLAWIIWIVLIIGFLMAIEFINDSIQRQKALGDMDDDALRNIYREQRLHKKPLGLPDLGAFGAHAGAHAGAHTASKEN